MEYQEFVVQFRARTEARMLEFEKALAQAETKIADAREQESKAAESEKVESSVRQTRNLLQVNRNSARSKGPVQSILRQA